MMKKTLALFLSLVIVLSIFAVAPITTSAASSAIIGSTQFDYIDLSDTTIEITRCFSSETKITIPSVIDGKTVVSLGDKLFERKSSLKEVTISDSVTSIGANAFYSCTGLTTVTIGNSVTSIGDNAFDFCISLTDVTIPDSVTSIGEKAFSRCYAITEITIPDSVTSIGNNAFEFCKALTEVTIGDGVTSIGDYTFNYCEALTKVTLGDNVTSIKYYAFSSCYSLYEITIPNSVTYIGDGVFSSCHSLPEITIPNSVTSIGHSVFVHCYALTEVTIPDSVTSIGEWIFYNCQGLRKVSIGNGVTSIKDESFGRCTSLTKVSIGDSVTSIGKKAFEYCISLPEITIPDSVTSIGEWAFWDCEGLTKVVISDANSDNSMTINDYAFISCQALTEITIPSRVTTIGNYAFSNCSAVSKITISEGVTYIGDSALSGYSDALTEIIVPYSVTYIGYHAFFPGQANLDDIYVLNPDCYIDDDFSTLGVRMSGDKPMIHAPLNSTAHQYAIKNENYYNFAELVEIPEEPEVPDTPVEPEKPEIVRPEKVENFHAEDITRNSFTLAWDPVEGATSYTIVNMVNGYNYETVYDGATSITIPDRKNGTTYKYAVIANFPDGTKMDVSKADVLELQVLNKVQNLKVTDVGKFNISLTWDEIEGAEYLVYVGEDLFTRTTDNSVVVNNRKSDSQYFVRVIAFFPGRPEYEQFALKDAVGVTVVTDKRGEITSDTSLDIVIPDEVKEADWNETKGSYNAWIMFGPSEDNIPSKDRFYELETPTYKASELNYGTDYYYYFRYFKDGVRYDTPVQKITTENNTTFDDITITYTTEGKAVVNWNVVNDATKFWIFKNGMGITSQSTNSAYTIDKFNDGDVITITALYEYKENRFKEFKYEAAVLKK